MQYLNGDQVETRAEPGASAVQLKEQIRAARQWVATFGRGDHPNERIFWQDVAVSALPKPNI